MHNCKIFLLTVVAFLAACGGSNSIEGVYICDPMMGTIELDLKGNGEGYATVNGMKTVIEYEIDEENLLLTGNGQTSVLTIDGETLVGDPFGTCRDGSQTDSVSKTNDQTDSVSKTNNQHMIGTYLCEGDAKLHLEIISDDKGFIESRSKPDEFPRMEFEYKTNDNEMTLTFDGEGGLLVLMINGSNLEADLMNVGSCPKS